MNEEPQRLLCWIVCAYRKHGMDEEDYHRYMSQVHAPLVKDLMVKVWYDSMVDGRVPALHSVRSSFIELMTPLDA